MANDVWSAQGTERTTQDVDLGLTAVGDTTAPNAPAGRVRIDPTTANALLVEFDEAMSPFSAVVLNNYALNGGIMPGPAVQLGPRDVRLTFLVQPIVGDTLDISVNDLAGNGTGSITRAVTAADAAGPLVSTVAGVITPSWGRDEVRVTFNEPVTSSSALNRANYTVTNGAGALSLTGARMSYDSNTNTVTMRLAGGVELDAGFPISVTIANVADFSGNTMGSPVVVGGSVTGDNTAPAFQGAFVNWRADVTGKIVDVLFSEDVDATFAGNTANWTASGSTVTSVTLPERNHAQVTLSAALAGGGTLQMTGLPDLARNASGAISVDPLE